jgi:hypothetical protein
VDGNDTDFFTNIHLFSNKDRMVAFYCSKTIFSSGTGKFTGIHLRVELIISLVKILIKKAKLIR